MSSKRPSSRIPGASPGTLVHHGKRRTETTQLRLFCYGRDTFEELATESLAKDALLPLVQEDVLDTHHQPKVEDHGSYLFVVLPELVSHANGKTTADHFTLILTENAVITFQEAPSTTLEPVLQRLRSGKGLIRGRGADYLAWAILDAVIDHYFLALERLEEMSDSLEIEVTRGGHEIMATKIFQFRNHVTKISRKIRAVREAVSTLQRHDSPLIDERNHVFYSDLHDHALHVVTMMEMLRESASSLRDFQMAAVSNRMNEIMKVLTTFATIFLPLTFLAGVYGMNFKHMPELDAPWAYPTVWGVFIVCALSMLAFFKWRRWL